MLVSHRRRFIFLKTSKTGGTSVESYFERECLPAGEWECSHFRDETVSAAGIIGYRGWNMPADCCWWNHMPAAEVRVKLGEEVWSTYFKFTVVRNPFDKTVSAFYFDSPIEPGTRFDSQREQRRFERWLESSPPWTDRDKYLIDGQLCVNHLIRYESLQADLADVCRRLQIPWEPNRLPRFKAGMRPPEATVTSLFSPRSRQMVEETYAWEFENFGYSFPGTSTTLSTLTSRDRHVA
ncbi:MAG: sulfotransferase family 2 domain-containing protein [Planctomycetaceae bacterium]|nr:sulfotransferase family 2 domain-containing protein [Planctomycetaceae bacterium]